MGEASSTSTLRTLMPSGGVWGVLSIMPRICFAAASAPAGSSASLTPPALPRPPACTWALTTTLPPSRAAMSFAWAGVSATSPFGTGTPNSRRMALAWYSWIFMRGLDVEQHPDRGDGPGDGGAVAQHREERPVPMQADVLEDEAETVETVVERQRDEHEEIELDHRLPDEREQPRVAQGHPPQRNGQAVQEKVHGHQEGGHHASHREEAPPEGLDGLARRHGSAPRQQPVEDEERHGHPGDEVAGHHQRGRHLAVADADHLNHARGHEPRHRVIEGEGQGHHVEDDPSRRAQLRDHGRIGLRSLRDLVDLDEEDHEEDRNEDTGHFPDHEADIPGTTQPPGRAHLRVIESGAGGARGGHCSELRESGAQRRWPDRGARGFIVASSASTARNAGGLIEARVASFLPAPGHEHGHGPVLRARYFG